MFAAREVLMVVQHYSGGWKPAARLVGAPIKSHRPIGSRTFSTAPSTTKRTFCTAKPVCSTTDEKLRILKESVFMFTDGSCLGNRNVEHVAQPAGWGVLAVRVKDDAIARIEHKINTQAVEDVLSTSFLTDILNPSNCDETARLFGPVSIFPEQSDEMTRAQQRPQAGPYFVLGASLGSNNTGELSAIGEAMLYFRDECSATLPRRCVILYDSEYAAKSVTGEYNGKKNALLIRTVRDVLKSVTAPVHFVKVKAHSSHAFNDVADMLANMGCAGQICSVGRFETSRIDSHK